jgi:rSAM/selenodomain-associated transferase 2
LYISIIIPVRNEEKRIGPCLDRLSGCRELEIIVVDGGSSDKTVREAAARGFNPLISRPGRGSQQHSGAMTASGDTLLFLHCDTKLPPDFTGEIHDILQMTGVAAGAFRLSIDAPGPGYRCIEFGANLRSGLLHLPYGDQAMFMKKNTYFTAGGFPDQPIMEDIVLLSRLKKMGRIVIAQTSAVTSARRWQQQGLLKTTIVNQLMLAGWAAGIAPDRLARWYYKPRS